MDARILQALRRSVAMAAHVVSASGSGAAPRLRVWRGQLTSARQDARAVFEQTALPKGLTQVPAFDRLWAAAGRQWQRSRLDANPPEQVVNIGAAADSDR